MANLSPSEALEVEELLNFYKETTLLVKNSGNHQFKVKGNSIETVISAEKSTRKSKRVQNTCKNPKQMMILMREEEGKKEKLKKEVIEEVEENKEVEEVDVIEENEEEEEVVNNIEEGRVGIFEQLNIVEQTKTYAEEDLIEIITQVIQVDPFGEEGSNKSVNEFNKINTCKSYKPRNKMPRVILKSLQGKENVAVKSLRKRKGQVRGKLNTSNRVITRSRTRPLKVSKTNFQHEKISNVLPTKNSKNTSNKRKNRSHSKDNGDSKGTFKRFPCTRCDKGFQYASDLKTHKVVHTGRKPYRCERCPCRYSQKSHLTRHLLTHKRNGRKFKCTICKKSFLHNFDLQIHLRTHSGDKPYTCNKCNKSFSQKSHLNTHMKSHEEKKYVCDRCQKPFTLLHHLGSHIKYVHKKF